MIRRKLTALALALLVAGSVTAQDAQRIPIDYPVSMFADRGAASTTGPQIATNGKPYRVVAGATSGTFNATVTIYGTDKLCGTTCTAADGTSLGTITTDGGSIVVAGYSNIFALVTAWTSGTIYVYAMPDDGGGGSKVVQCADDGDVDTLEALCTIPLDGYDKLSICGTVATSALTAFQVQGSNDGGSSFVTLFGGASGTTSSDYTTPRGHLHTVTANPIGWTTTGICLNFDGLNEYSHLKFNAAGTSSNPALTARLSR